MLPRSKSCQDPNQNKTQVIVVALFFKHKNLYDHRNPSKEKTIERYLQRVRFGCCHKRATKLIVCVLFRTILELPLNLTQISSH